ncbi:MAG TPA: dethiobiotin synthase [Candidatus Binataceae bacterium]|nr:dethiobiotin synthase [Candidatus Binataceae bacterium]
MTARALLITGTDTGVGKTLVGCALAFAAKARGLRVGVMKPAETGCAELNGELAPADAQALLCAASSALALDLVCPYRYPSPLAPARAAEADGLEPPDPERIERCFRAIASESDLVIVEGAGGIAVPLTWRCNYADLALRLGLEAVLVVGNRLGCLNAAFLSVSYMRARSLRLRGVVLSDLEPTATPATVTNADALVRMIDAPYVGRIRHKEPVSRAIIEALLG